MAFYYLLRIFVICCVFLIAVKIFNKVTAGVCKCMTCLVGKTALITGGTSGIGFETAIVLASRGCRVIIASRSASQKHKDEIISRTNNRNIETKYLDLSSLECVRKFARELIDTEERLDILINNAGAGGFYNKFTADGLHPIMQTNHFGPFLLTHLLVDLLKKSEKPSRVIFISSLASLISGLTRTNLNYPEGHAVKFFRIMEIYANSKLCNIIAANGFAEKLRSYKITVNSLHPGLIDTDIYTTVLKTKYQNLTRISVKSALKIFGKSVEEGIQTTIHLAMASELESVTGEHFWDCRKFFLPPKARNKQFCNDIWEQSEKLVGLAESEKLPAI